VADDVVEATAQLDFRDVLRGTERYLVELMLQMGPVCRVEEMWQMATSDGIGKMSFWVVVGNSPAIVRYAKSTYGLRGMGAPATDVWDVANRHIKRAGSVQLAAGSVDDQVVWFAQRLSNRACDSGQLGIPAELQSRFEGSCSVASHGKRTQWSCAVHDTCITGLCRALRIGGAEAGDVALVAIDPRESLVHVLIGGDELALVDGSEVRDLIAQRPTRVTLQPDTARSGPAQHETASTRSRSHECETPRETPDVAVVAAVVETLQKARQPMRASDIAFSVTRALGIRVDKRDVDYCLKTGLKGRAALVSGTEWVLLS